MSPKLTTHLATLTPTPLKTATTHPFLTLAGKGLLPKQTLSSWLSQDRLYAQSYIRFIGSLLSKIHLPTTPKQTTTTSQKTVTILIDALVNIQRELSFFEDVAGEYGLELTVAAEGEGTFGPNPITHGYIDMFASAGNAAASVLEGLVVLWATEMCYLRAWRFARSVMEGGGEGEKGGLDGGALRERFIPNWTSGEFEEFVDGIGEVVDAWVGEMEDGKGKEEVVGRCERWWRQVIWLEERFWPDVNHLL